MSLSQRIDEELKAALKAGDAVKVSTLRMLKAAMGNLAIERKKATLEDSEVQEAVRRLAKQHEESVEAYRKACREDRVQKESQELAILKAYLPTAMEESELKGLIQQTIQELKVPGTTNMGQVMKAVILKVQGRADGKRVNQLVAQMLKGA